MGFRPGGSGGPGGLFHWVTKTADGLRVTDVWKSKEVFEKFSKGLMREFVVRGAMCHLIDYCQTPIPGVSRIGTNEEDLPREGTYNAIICSHVLEHLAEPFKVAQSLADCLQTGGVLYVEVPMEIWRKPPLPKEPLTHVNFFTPASLLHLMRRAGLSVRSCRLISYAYGSGPQAIAVECVAARGSPVSRQLSEPLDSTEAERFLNPDLALALYRFSLMPTTVLRSVLRRSLGFP